MDEPLKTDSPPEWAASYVRGAVRLGMSVPEIEEHLVSKGMLREDANRLIMDTMFGPDSNEPASRSGDWGKPIRLCVSMVIAGACLLLAYQFGAGPSVGLALIWVVPELFAIWLPELTNTLDSDWGQRSWFAGWFILLLYLGYRIFVWATWPSPV